MVVHILCGDGSIYTGGMAASTLPGKTLYGDYHLHGTSSNISPSALSPHIRSPTRQESVEQVICTLPETPATKHWISAENGLQKVYNLLMESNKFDNNNIVLSR